MSNVTIINVKNAILNTFKWLIRLLEKQQVFRNARLIQCRNLQLSLFYPFSVLFSSLTASSLKCTQEALPVIHSHRYTLLQAARAAFATFLSFLSLIFPARMSLPPPFLNDTHR